MSDQKYLNFSTNPADNNAPPPVGAPEGATNVSALNDIDRYDKAAIADLAEDTVTNGIGAQAPAAIAFTGGSITGLTAIRTIPTFVPTDDYDLATKTYVDQAVAGAVAGPVQSLIDATLETALPVGTVLMWNGVITGVPTFGTWQLCDGTNGTLDLRNIMLKGCDIDANLGNTGGNTTATTDGRAITEAQMPAHTHSSAGLGTDNDTHQHFATFVGSGNNPPVGASTTIVSSDAGGGGVNAYALGGLANTADAGLTNNDTHNHNVTGTLGSTGSGQAHDHDITLPEPLHRRIYFIQRTA